MTSHKRTVFLTGGARGIGAAIREELTLRGCEVVAPSRNELDLANPQAVEKYLADHRDLYVDILINNAGINTPQALTEISQDYWQESLQANLSASLRLIQFFAPGMGKRGFGRILNISSIFSLVTKEGRCAYSMTKAALNALTRSAAVEFGPSGILVNALAPGYVDTEMTRKNNSPAAIAELADSIPLRHLAHPSDLAKAAAFLVSDENKYITGQTIVADGGFTCL
jgi:3-oxoacyl-[acyl-carrier protein] reductase